MANPNLNAFSIVVDAQTDTSKIQKTLNQKKFVLKVDIDLKNAVKKAESAVSQLNSSLGDGFERVGRSIKTGLSGIYNGKQLKNLIQYTEKFRDELGNVAERISVISKNGKLITSTTTDVKKAVSEIQQITDKNKTTIEEQGKTFQATVTTTKTVADGQEELTKTVTSYVNAQGYAVEKTQTFNKAGQQVGTTVTKMSRDMTTLRDNTKKIGQSFDDILKKVTKFYLASLPIRLVTKIISEGTTAIKEYDSAIVELSKVSNYGAEELNKYAESLGEIGEKVGRTKTEMVQSATEFKKGGFSEEDSAKLAELSALYQNTADEILSASEATSVLISQMKAFNMTADDAIVITDAINKVSADFAVSSADIGKGLTQAGASLSTYGNTFYETIGLVTAGTEINFEKSPNSLNCLETPKGLYTKLQ